jgi:hypothetical protein
LTASKDNSCKLYRWFEWYLEGSQSKRKCSVCVEIEEWRKSINSLNAQKWHKLLLVISFQWSKKNIWGIPKLFLKNSQQFLS